MNKNLTTTIALLIFLIVLITQTVSAQTTPDIPLRGKPIADKPAAPSQTPAEQTLQRIRQTTTPLEVLKNAKTIFVRSQSLLVGQAVIESKLRKRQEFQQLGLIITRDPSAADLILEVEHDLFTKYVFTAIDPWTNMVVASGKLSSLGGTVAGKVAKRFMKQVMKAKTG